LRGLQRLRRLWLQSLQSLRRLCRMQLRLLHFVGRLPLPLLDSIAFSIALTGLSAPLPRSGDALLRCPRESAGGAGWFCGKLITDRW
jgi:hypothetical protein